MANLEHMQWIMELGEKYIDERIAVEVRDAVAPVEDARAKAAAEASAALAVAESRLREIATLTVQNSDLSGKLADAEKEVVALKKRIAELEAGEPDPEPEPEPARTFIGACPLTGGMTSNGIKLVTDRYADGAAVRLFSSSGWTPGPALGDAGRLMLSWKPSLSSAINEDNCVAALANVPAGSKVCVWHEPDVKARKGDAVAPMKARAKEFYSIVKRRRPDLDVMAVLSGWTFDPSTNYNPLDYIELGTFDVLALDLDGLSGPKDYRPVVTKALAWMRANGVKRWTVAEYGVKTEAGFTTTDRLAWLKTQTASLLAQTPAPEEIAYFETDSSAEGRLYIMSTPEVAYWRSLIEE